MLKGGDAQGLMHDPPTDRDSPIAHYTVRASAQIVCTDPDENFSKSCCGRRRREHRDA
jgi:hypothetical protein